MGVQRGAKHFAFIKRNTPIYDATTRDTRSIRRVIHKRFPNLSTSHLIQCHRRCVGRDVHFSVMDERKGFLPARITKLIGPFWSEPPNIVEIYSSQPAVPSLPLAHSIS